MKVNGNTIKLKASVSLKHFLESSGYTTDKIAVEHNGEIVPKNTYETRMLKDADTLEIVQFVGGG